jgi:NAD(P)-dependent dehydrogenase (short-subunit alcohol dehydrogenase family)
MSEYFDLTGKVAVITGGAGGLGHVMAIGLAKHGADIVVVSRSQSKLDPVAAEIRALGRKAMAIAADVTDEKAVANMVEQVVKEFGKIDILVNGAGMALRKAADVLTVAEWKQVMELNTLGTFICCQAVARVMMKQKSGKIINLSSIRSRFGTSLGGVVYGPSKGAIDSLTRTLACEWGKYNIYVNAIAPSLILTELSKPMFADPIRLKANTERIPLGRMGELDDVVGPVVFLASKASSFVSGQIIPVDGGNSAGFM